MSKIYIETDMTEMPKSCFWAEEAKGFKKHIWHSCPNRTYCTIYGKTPLQDTRPEWCPLKQGMLVDKEVLKQTIIDYLSNQEVRVGDWEYFSILQSPTDDDDFANALESVIDDVIEKLEGNE